MNLRKQNGSLWHLVRMSFVIVCCFVITSCFPGDQSQQSGSVEEFMRQQQSTAVSYSRSFQNYSALSQQALAKEVWDTGVVALPANGLIDMSQFGAQYNVGNSDGYLQSAYCDNGGGDEYHLTWFKGANDPDTGAMEPMDLKGLGTTGYSAILKTLAKEMSPSAYGTYDKQNQVLSPIKGTQIAMNCPAAQFIPVGAPVIFTPIEQVNFRGNEEYYEYQDIACADPDDIGKIRQRRVVARIMDANGNVISEESKGWEDFISTCQAEPSVPSISADVSGTASVVNFADMGLGSSSEPCFEATIIREDDGGTRPPGQGEPGDNGQITETISNCDNGDGIGALPPGQSLSCGSDPIEVKKDTVLCSGNDWGGTAEYEQEIYECEILQDGVPTGNFYKQRMEWKLTSVDCSRNETTYFDCPVGPGQFTYTRVNRITDPSLPLTPTNPEWNYNETALGHCSALVPATRDCHKRYIGNEQVIPATLSGEYGIRLNSNPHTSYPKNGINTLCDAGGVDVCTEYDDTLLCPVANMNGDREEERTYTCTGSNAGDWSDWTETTNDCACRVWTSGAENISCYNSTPNNCFGSAGSTCATAGDTCIQATNLDYPGWYDDQVCAVSPGTGEAYNVQTLTCTEYTDEESCTACNEFETEIDTQPCGGPHSGDRTLERSKICPSGEWTDWVEVSNSCTCDNSPYIEREVACGSGQSGMKTQRAIRDDATCEYGPYTDLDTSQCVNVCTPANPPEYRWTGVSVTQGCVDLGNSGDGVCETAADVGKVTVSTSYEDSPAPGTFGCQDGSGPSAPYSYYHYLTITSVCEPYTGCVSCPTEGEVQTRNEEQVCGANEIGTETRTSFRTCTDVNGSLYWSDWQELAWDDSGCVSCTNESSWMYNETYQTPPSIPMCTGGVEPTGSCTPDDRCFHTVEIPDTTDGAPEGSTVTRYRSYTCVTTCMP